MPLALMVGAAIAATTTPSRDEAEQLATHHERAAHGPVHLLDDGHHDMRMLRISVEPGAPLPWHRDTVPDAGYLIEGELHVRTREGERKVMRPGDCLAESMEAVRRGTAGPRGATVLVFYSNEDAARG
jgi:quercetin dioxygenase-like cupin family protein